MITAIGDPKASMPNNWFIIMFLSCKLLSSTEFFTSVTFTNKTRISNYFVQKPSRVKMFSSISEILSWLLLALVFVYLSKWLKIYNKCGVVFLNIPGPKAYPLIGSAYRFIITKREERYALKLKLHNQFPTIMSLWFGQTPQVHLKRAEHLEKILCNSKEHLQKGWVYEMMRPWMGDGLIMSTGDKWHRMRKMLTPAFHFGILDRFCEIFAEKADDFVDKINEFSDTGKSFRIHSMITEATLEIVAEAAMGTTVYSLDSNFGQYLDDVHVASELVIKRMITPWHYIQFVYNLSRSGRKYVECCDNMNDYVNKVIENRRVARNNQTIVDHSAIKKHRPAFLDLLLTESEKPETPLTNIEIIDEVQNLMAAGYDTTASTISWVLYVLGRNLDIQEEVFSEIQSIFNNSTKKNTTQDLNQLDLLDRVIKETLRLYPPVPFFARTLSDDVQLDHDYLLPKGTSIAVETTLLHRDPRYFPDPERFDPDRFLPDNVHGRHPLAYIPFSAGARNCIGQKFGVYMMKSVLVALIKNFQFKGVGNEEVQIDEITAKPLYGVELLCSRRL